ncbi:MAG: serine protease [Pirellulales bacterium]
MRVWSSLLALLVLVTGGIASADSPVFDDLQLLRGFARGAGALADAETTLDSATIDGQLKEAAGKTVVSPQAATPCALGPEQSLYDAVVPAVVAVGSVFKCGKCNDWHVGQMASGWILSADGLVVTNHHVLERAEGNRYGVMTSDGAVYGVQKVVAADVVGDAAVIHIDTRGRSLPFLRLGPRAACGSPVTVISHPKGRFYSLTTGIVSRYHRMWYDEHPNRAKFNVGQTPATWMTVTADFAIGSSGGPVFNAVGEVVGMVSRTSPGRAAAPGKPPEQPPAGGEQMIFKECVSADTLRALVGGELTP